MMAIAAAVHVVLAAVSTVAQSARFSVTISPDASAEPVTGRLLVIVAKSPQPEPRHAISPHGPAMFAIDLEEQEPGEPVLVDDDSALGYPWPLRELPAGEYHVQALVNVYEQVRRSDGRVLWLPMNDGTQETAGVAVGNLYGDVRPFRVDTVADASGTATATDPIELDVTHVVPPRSRPADTEWVKRVRLDSRKLAEFWGRPIGIHATVLLPKGYAERPDVRYPAIYTMGHNVPFSFTTRPSEGREGGALHPTTGLESGYEFHKAWISDGFPRVIAISFEQQTPFFPDS